MGAEAGSYPSSFSSEWLKGVPLKGAAGHLVVPGLLKWYLFFFELGLPFVWVLLIVLCLLQESAVWSYTRIVGSKTYSFGEVSVAKAHNEAYRIPMRSASEAVKKPFG